MSSNEANAERSPAPDAELSGLLSAIEFTALQGAWQTGPSWLVYVHPWEGAEPGFFDALISLSARGPELAGARGVRLSLRRDNIVWLAAEGTDERGQVWFRNLPAGTFRIATASPAPAPKEEEAALAGASEDLLAAQSTPPPADRLAPCGWRFFRLPDRRVSALLEETHDAWKSSLLVSTTDPALADAKVRFAFGELTGSVELGKAEAPARWSARAVLKRRFPALARELPRFTVVPATGPQSPPDDADF